MYFVEIALKNLINRRLRTFFTFLAVASAMAAFLCFIGLARGIKEAWTEALMARGTHLVAMPRGVVDVLNASVDEAIGEEMARTEGVAAVSGELLDLIETDAGEVILAVGWPVKGFLWNSIKLEQGSIPSEISSDSLVVGKNIAVAFHLKPGDLLELRGRKFVVAGISAAGDPLRNNAVIMPLKALQGLCHRPGKVATLNFSLANPEDKESVSAILSNLKSRFPDFVFSETKNVAENNRLVRVFKAMAWGVSAVALFIAVVVILNTLLMSILERTKELGILNAVGWSGRRIVSLVVIEGLLLAGAGGCGGMILGLAGTAWLSQCNQIRGIIYPSVDWILLLETGLATMALGLLGSVYPAIRALSLEPSEALRHE